MKRTKKISQMRQAAAEITKLNGGKSRISIGDAREVLKHVAIRMALIPEFHAAMLQTGLRRRMEILRKG